MSRVHIRINDSVTISPVCRDCDHRSAGCHAVCEAYAAFRLEADRRMEARRQRKQDNEIAYRGPWKGSRWIPEAGLK